ncbi:tetratricopeptide repeat protein [Pseudodesulfovibrio cashew]|uniref:Tetratricopeptide repeat protein n=1 Tax=Pseudodesulfovibrio cashew TaxID=2678688 RepID=A0A6I6J7Q3_9BACT|nr:tetratricopeptide repeat protein [Pseudodesulfovibrio cashew]QGY38856.1 tetratricopeptide repeat protein [Pseudodesulfovibrio cashew]
MKKLIVIATVMLLLAGMAGCAAKSKEDPSFKEFAYGKDEGIPLSAEQHEQVGDGLLRRGQDEMAFMHYAKAAELDEENLDVRVKKADLLCRKGLDEQALAEYIKVLEKDADHAVANGAAGAIYFRAGLYNEARTHLEKSVRLNPMLWKSYNYLGILDDKDGHYEMAADNFAKAIDLHRGNNTAEIYNNLGVVHIARKQYGMAVDAFRRALKTGGASARTYNNLGLALTRLGRLDEALEAFKYAGGDSKANNNLGYVLLTDNQPEKAVAYFEKAIELSPSFYVKAADNLKRARLAARFKEANDTIQTSGSTPNPLLHESFPDSEQNPGEPAASPASAGSPSVGFKKISHVQGSGDHILTETYGLHVGSYKDHKRAFTHCEQLRKQGFSTWINQIDLGDKGIWYRVLVGEFPTIKAAQTARPDVLAVLGLDRATVYARVMPKPKGASI